MGLANNYFVEKHYPQAKEFYNRSIKIFTKKGDLSAIANAYKNLYKVEKASQNDIKAIDYLI